MKYTKDEGHLHIHNENTYMNPCITHTNARTLTHTLKHREIYINIYM